MDRGQSSSDCSASFAPVHSTMQSHTATAAAMPLCTGPFLSMFQREMGGVKEKRERKGMGQHRNDGGNKRKSTFVWQHTSLSWQLTPGNNINTCHVIEKHTSHIKQTGPNVFFPFSPCFIYLFIFLRSVLSFQRCSASQRERGTLQPMHCQTSREWMDGGTDWDGGGLYCINSLHVRGLLYL